MSLSLALAVMVPVGASDQEDADGLAAQGLAAMRDADTDPHRGVDAAIDFSHALTLYKRIGDMDAICEMQADIFWCKKRMNIDDLQNYLAEKGAAATSDFVIAKHVIETQVPASEADGYLARAREYQSDHPDHHYEIAIRFSEITERFPDTAAAHEAAQIFMLEQSSYLNQVAQERQQEKAQVKQALQQIVTTRFMLPPSVGSGSTAVPDTMARGSALLAVKTAYHDDYQNRSAQGKRTLSKRLYEESAANQDNAAYFYEMLDESARLAVECGDWQGVLAAVEKQGEVFVHFDVNAHKAEILAKGRADPIAAAIITLLKDPRDQQANLLAGRAFCFTLDRWDLGLPMLANAPVGPMRTAAQLELSNPSQAAQQRSLADLWYELGRHAGYADKMAQWGRAQYWYRLSQADLGGINQSEVAQRLDAIEDALPLAITDWDTITMRQWQRLKGHEVSIDGKVDRGDGEVDVREDHPVRIVPCPQDLGKMVFQLGSLGPRQPAGILEGSGHLWVFPTSHHPDIRDLSVLRFKIVDAKP